MLVVASPTYRRFDALRNCIQSAFNGSLSPDIFLVIDNSGGGFQYNHPKVKVLQMPYNLGVARSWNLAFSIYGAETLIITNDDVEFYHDTIETMVKHKSAADFIYPSINPENMFSLFLMNLDCWMDVGPFDPHFYPAYFEDNDYHERMKKKGRTILKVNTSYYHIGSATIKSYTEQEMIRHHIQFNKNREYFYRKHGKNE